MRGTIGFVLGVAASAATIYVGERQVYSASVISFACHAEGRTGVYTGDHEFLCADLSDAYPSDEALDRIIGNLQAGLDRAAEQKGAE